MNPLTLFEINIRSQTDDVYCLEFSGSYAGKGAISIFRHMPAAWIKDPERMVSITQKLMLDIWSELEQAEENK